MMTQDYADSAQARETDKPQLSQRQVDFFADQDAQVEQESAERREAANAACRARLAKAIAQMEVICGYRK